MLPNAALIYIMLLQRTLLLQHLLHPLTSPASLRSALTRTRFHRELLQNTASIYIMLARSALLPQSAPHNGAPRGIARGRNLNRSRMEMQPNAALSLKEKFAFVKEGPGKTKHQTVRWRNSGIRLQPLVPTNLNNGIAERKRIPLPLMQYCLMHSVHEEVRDCLSGDAHPVQPLSLIHI